MNKTVYTAVAMAALSISMTNIARSSRLTSEANKLGQQVIRELGEGVKRANLAFRAATGEAERQEALKNAHDAAKNLLNTLNDIKTYGSDIIRGYNAAQRRQAAITLAELLTRENSINIEITNSRMEIADMTEKGYVFNFPKQGKAETLAQTRKNQKDLYTTQRDIGIAISSQELILGEEWSNIIKLAVQNLIVGSSYGIAYGIDWYFGDHGAKLLTENHRPAPVTKMASKGKRSSMPLTKQERAAIRSWQRLRKSELLSQEISTAYQLTQAKELLNKLNVIKEDLKNVPAKYKHFSDTVTKNADYLSREINRVRTRWLK